MSNYQLPYYDGQGFTNCLLSAIGGDGANMAAKILFKIGATYLNLDGAYDAKYGSEKKGTPTDVSLRLCDFGTPVRESGPNNRPHILCIFRENLIRPLKLNKGLQENATVIVNTCRSAAEIREELQLHSGTIITLDAQRIAIESHSRLNMPMMAMLAYVLKFPEADVLHYIESTWPKAVTANVSAYKMAVAESHTETFAADGKYELVPPSEERGGIGYLSMLNGGAIDSLTHCTVTRSNAGARSNPAPEFNREACIDCAKCLMVCADPGAIVWKEQKMAGIDLSYCKACLRCVAVCPTTKKGKALNEGGLTCEL